MKARAFPKGAGVRGLRSTVVGSVLAAVLVSACAISSAEEQTGTDFNRITEEELRETRAVNLYELVERERPRWLISRGARSFHLETEIVVAVDRRYYGGVDALRQFKPEEVHEMVYLDGPTATATINGLGSRHVEGAIALEMRRR